MEKITNKHIEKYVSGDLFEEKLDKLIKQYIDELEEAETEAEKEAVDDTADKLINITDEDEEETQEFPKPGEDDDHNS